MKAARLIGGAGTGKTTELMAIMDKLLAREIGPLEVGFCSFTRAARREAATRAADRFGVPVPVLEREGRSCWPGIQRRPATGSGRRSTRM